MSLVGPRNEEGPRTSPLSPKVRVGVPSLDHTPLPHSPPSRIPQGPRWRMPRSVVSLALNGALGPRPVLTLTPPHSLQPEPVCLPPGLLLQRRHHECQLLDTGLPGRGLLPRASDSDLGLRVPEEEHSGLPQCPQPSLEPLHHRQPDDRLRRVGQADVHLQRGSCRLHHQQDHQR